MPKIEEDWTFPNSFYKVSVTLKLKLDKSTKKIKLEASIPDAHRHTRPQQNISKPNSTIYKNYHISWSNGMYSRDVRIVHYLQIGQYDMPH